MIRRGGVARSRALEPHDLGAALALCARDPVANVLAAVRLAESGGHAGLGASGWGVFSDAGDLDALAWLGANLVPVSPGGLGVADLARAALLQRRTFSSIVGDAPVVHALWSHVEAAWPRPRQLRLDQPSLVLDGPARVAADPNVRPAVPAEADLVLPTSAAMFTEEYGYSPLGSGGAYAARVHHLVAAGRSFVRMGQGPRGPRVEFKAEIGAFALGVAQVQGVWVEPELRGRGLGAAGMAAVAEHARALGAQAVSLYVNDYNAPARATYRRVGFRQVGSYATIVL